MPRKSRENPEIRAFILEHVSDHPGDIRSVTAKHFKVNSVTIARYLRKLVDEGALATSGGETKARRYHLAVTKAETFVFDLSRCRDEGDIWREKIAPLLADLPENVLYFCQYGSNEMMNNAIDHSGGAHLTVRVSRDAVSVTIIIQDDGIGIFEKIRRDYNLDDPRHALLELSKGKLTTDPDKHSGEGIFFTSRMFDDFSIWSGGLFFRRFAEHDDDWLIEVTDRSEDFHGTYITMQINVNSTRTAEQLFNKYANDDRGFSRTHVPVRLARYGNEQLVSRSQARRVLARFNKFSEVILDFKDVPRIGQAFADEIFRVFRREHPETSILWTRASPEVRQMIDHVTKAVEPSAPPASAEPQPSQTEDDT